MAKTTRKLVLSVDNETQSYRPAGHNLTPEQATEETQKLQGEGTTALIVDQTERHRALSFHQCRLCKKAAEDATNKHSQTASDEQQQQEAAPASEDTGGD